MPEKSTDGMQTAKLRILKQPRALRSDIDYVPFFPAAYSEYGADGGEKCSRRLNEVQERRSPR